MQPETFYLKKSKFYAPVCTINIPEEYFDNKIYNKGIDEEIKWLDNVCLQMEITPWAKDRSEKNRSIVGIPGTNVLLNTYRATSSPISEVSMLPYTIVGDGEAGAHYRIRKHTNF